MQSLILLLVAICCLVVSKADIDCHYKYRTVNAFESVSRVNVSCYLTEGVCELLYTPRNRGCDTIAISIGAVESGTTKEISYGFEYGSAICSNYQIAVNHLRNATLIQWPRPTDSGRRFSKVVWNPRGVYQQYRIHVSSFAIAARVDVWTSVGESLSFTLQPYHTEYVDIDVNKYLTAWIALDSKTPIIVTYSDYNEHVHQYFIWQPNTVRPIRLYVPSQHSITYGHFTCDGNHYETSTPSVKIDESPVLEYNCDSVKTVTGSLNVVSYGEACWVTVTPTTPNVCLSVSLYASIDENYAPRDMGLPENKFSRILIGNRLNTTVNIISDYPIVCKETTTIGEKEIVLKPFENKYPAKHYYVNSDNERNVVNRIECPVPVYFRLNGIYEQNIANTGAAPDELWNEYIGYELCPLPPPQIEMITSLTPPPTPAPTLPPVDTMDLSPSYEQINASNLTPAFLPASNSTAIISSSAKMSSVNTIGVWLGFTCTYLFVFNI